MRIALVNENSQAGKNSLIYEVLKEVAEPLGHTVFNYGKYSAEDPHPRSYVQAGLLTAILINAKAADFVVTGCGTGEGAMISANAFPNVHCGFAVEPSDGAMFRRINNGNALSLPYAKGFGWGAELNLRNIFEQMLSVEPGCGYPLEMAGIEQHNKRMLDQMKSAAHRDMLSILKDMDQAFVKEALAEESFKEMFFANCDPGPLAEYIRDLLRR